MTEDDEAKQRARDVAHQASLSAGVSSPGSYDKAGQISKSQQQPAVDQIDLAAEDARAQVDDKTPEQRLLDAQGNDAEPSAGQRQQVEQVVVALDEKASEDEIQRLCDQQAAAIRYHRKHHHHHNNNHNNNDTISSSNNIHRQNSNSQHTQRSQQSHSPAMSLDGTQAASQQQVANPPVSADYLAQLIKDKKQLAALPASLFHHVPRLVEDEIQKVRHQFFQLNDVASAHQQPLELPEPEGEFVSLQEKIYVPVDEHPEYNFVGRLLGPRGMTAKQLEQETGCKIMIRGKGSMRDKKKEEQNRGKANWEHLSDDLHVLITVEDTQTRAQLKLGRAIEEVRQLLVPVVDGEDELKKRQLMELAIINGTYRDCNYNEALNKMLNDTAYRQSQLLIEHGSPTIVAQQNHEFIAVGSSDGSPPMSGAPSTGPNSRHFPAHQQHYSSSTTASTNHDGSSGFPSSGSTPNSLQHGAGHHQVVTSGHHAHTRHHPYPGAHHGLPPGQHQFHLASGALGSPHPTTVAVVAAAAAAAAASQHQQGPGPHSGPTSTPGHHMHHAHSNQAQAAAAAASAALMSNPAEANAILYAQQFHDFQHYAAMAAIAAASQSILPPPPQVPPDYQSLQHHSYAHLPHQPPPHPHHPQHPHHSCSDRGL